jgi:hypothetical protein
MAIGSARTGQFAPPIRYGKMVGIDLIMTEQVLSSNQGA